ncbi:hypothetical protein ACFWIW_35690 [Amycolatopsis sp. NPDC058340]|uniref:hypothetical protein n=1 Tax=Amycolatopsis sp. NPDC058340 TaxID=3346453 RepID=UPI003646EFFB
MRSVHGKVPRLLSIGLSATLGITLLTGAQATAVSPIDAAPGEGRTVLLVTGDRVEVRESAGRQTAVVRPRDGSSEAFLTQQEKGGSLYVIPSSALPYLGTTLDRSLFDVSALARAGLTDSVPVDITGTAPGVVGGEITAATAPAFGAALAAQAAADRGRPGHGKLFGTADFLRLAGTSTPAVVTPRADTHAVGLLSYDDTGAPNNVTVGITNLDDVGRYRQFVNTVDGKVGLNLPEGRYEAAAIMPRFVDGRFRVRFVIQNFTVTGNRTVVVDGRTATVPASSSTPEPADLVGNSAHYSSEDAGGILGLDIGFNAKDWADYYFSPAPAPEVGTRHVAIGEHKASPANAKEPYTYDLKFRVKGALGDNLRHTYRKRDLASLHVAYYGDLPHETGQARMSLFDFEGMGVAFYRYFPAPARRTEYVVGSPDLSYQDNVIATRQGGGSTRGHLRTYRPGSTETVDYHRGPLAPGIATPPPGDAPWICAGCRQGDSMLFYLAPLLDADGRVYLWDRPGTSARLQLLKEDGTGLMDIADTHAGKVTVPAENGRYRAVIDVTRDGPWFRHSTASHTEWTFTSGHADTQTVPDNWVCSDNTPTNCSVLPLITAAAKLDTGLDGTLPVGLAQMGVTFGHAPSSPKQAIAKASAEVSFDNGKSWRKTVMIPIGQGRYTAYWINPSSAQGHEVALRLNATDAAGNSITQSVTAAYSVAKR